jgi:RNA polymerase sigma factor (sigma-70 family)
MITRMTHPTTKVWTNATTSAVVDAAALGDDGAWTELHGRYNRMIARIARTFGCGEADIADIQQAVWARLFQNIRGLRQPELIGGWLAVVARRECIRFIRGRKDALPVDDVACLAPSEEEPVVILLRSEVRAAVRRAVADLAPRRRSLLETILDNPDISYEQLSARLDIPVGSIGPTRQRGLDQLRRRRELVDWKRAAKPAHLTASAN